VLALDASPDTLSEFIEPCCYRFSEAVTHHLVVMAATNDRSYPTSYIALGRWNLDYKVALIRSQLHPMVFKDACAYLDNPCNQRNHLLSPQGVASG
jgi:hypothetical protein